MAFTYVTVTNDYDLADGLDPAGTVTFTPTAAMVNSGVVVVAAPVAHRVGVDGVLSIDLCANTDPDTSPAGVTYLVKEELGGAVRSYYVTIPHDQGSSIVLSSLATLTAAPSVGTAYLTTTSADARYARSAVVALVDAATIATDASLGSLFRVTLGGNRTLGNPTNPTNGQVCTWELIQDGTGSRTLALDTAFALGTTISSTTLTTTASKRDFLTAVYNSTAGKWYVTNFVKGY